MRTIQIEIKKARLLNYRIDFPDNPEELPEVRATIGLYTENNKKISEFSLSSAGYYGTEKIDMPADMIIPIVEIGDCLETIAARAATAAIGLLPDAV